MARVLRAKKRERRKSAETRKKCTNAFLYFFLCATGTRLVLRLASGSIMMSIIVSPKPRHRLTTSSHPLPPFADISPSPRQPFSFISFSFLRSDTKNKTKDSGGSSWNCIIAKSVVWWCVPNLAQHYFVCFAIREFFFRCGLCLFGWRSRGHTGTSLRLVFAWRRRAFVCLECDVTRRETERERRCLLKVLNNIHFIRSCEIRRVGAGFSTFRTTAEINAFGKLIFGAIHWSREHSHSFVF